MYSYKKLIPLNREEILKRVSEKDIFKIVFEEISFETRYKAPYREDRVGDCYFEEFNGSLVFVDFADLQSVYTSKNCFDTVGRCLSLDYKQTLQYINTYYNLGLGHSVVQPKEILYEVTQKKDTLYKIKNNTIAFIPIPFSQKDKLFWQKYEISKSNLIEDKVFSISLYTGYSKHNEPFCIKPHNEIMYAYTDFPNDKVKIYRPNAPDKLGKWFTNCNQNDMGSINHLPKKGKLLIITKSYKDCRVLRNLGFNSIWTQNEGMIPNDEILKNLCKRFKKIIIWFDNDNIGIAKSVMFKEHINRINTIAESIFLPPILLREKFIKDPSDCMDKDRNFLIEFINKTINNI
jgi:hypothetical protein